MGSAFSALRKQTYGPLIKYKVTPDGEIQTLNPPERNGGSSDRRLGYQASPPSVDDYLKRVVDYPYGSLEEAQSASEQVKQDKKLGALRLDFDRKLADITSQENTRNSLAQQIAALSGTNQPGATIGAVGANQMYMGGSPNFNEATGRYDYPSGGIPPGGLGFSTFQKAGISEEQQKILNDLNKKMIADPTMGFPKGTTIDEKTGQILYPKGYFENAVASNSQQNPAITALSSGNNFATSPLANKLNFQVSDQQILDDYNTTKVARLNSIVQQGNTQVAGIQQRLTAAQTLLDQLPKGDARYTSSKVYVDQLKSDLNSVTEAITGANKQIKEFKPIGVGTPEAASQITSFREYLQLPEERATEQLRQIDPESYQTAVELGKKYREMATAPIGETKSAQAEQLRSNLEQEAINQLALGSQLGAEEQRQYQQAARAAQTARGNIFGVAPAVEEAVTTGLAGEQRKLARYGAATQFLASGQNTSDALKSDIAFRDALLQNRLGAASGFIAGGPSLYNLGQSRTGAQQGAFQSYIQANQALPGGFNQQPSTASPFYQAVDQGIPVNLTNTFANLYGSQANYLANTYGAQVGALSRAETGSQAFGNIASGLGSLFSFSKGF